MYPPISPPAGIPARPVDSTKRQLRELFAWFQSVIPERLAILQSAIRATPAGASWAADNSLESLRGLDEWFLDHVAFIPRQTPEPIRLRGRQVATVDYDLTGETFTRSFDCGICWGQSLIASDPAFKWDVLLNVSVRNTSYGHAVVRGLGRNYIDPVSYFVTKAHGKIQGSRNLRPLNGLHEPMVQVLRGNPPPEFQYVPNT